MAFLIDWLMDTFSSMNHDCLWSVWGFPWCTLISSKEISDKAVGITHGKRVIKGYGGKERVLGRSTKAAATLRRSMVGAAMLGRNTAVIFCHEALDSSSFWREEIRKVVKDGNKEVTSSRPTNDLVLLIP